MWMLKLLQPMRAMAKKQMMGKEYLGIFRNTFVIDPEGMIEKIYLTVKAEPHPAQVLADITI